MKHLIIRVSGSMLLQSSTCSGGDGGTLCRFVMHSNVDPWGCVHYIVFIWALIFPLYVLPCMVSCQNHVIDNMTCSYDAKRISKS